MAEYEIVEIADKKIGLCKYVNYLLHIEYFLNLRGKSGLFSLKNGSNFYFSCEEYSGVDFLPYFFEQRDFSASLQLESCVRKVRNLSDVGFDSTNLLSNSVLQNIFYKKLRITNGIVDSAAETLKSIDIQRTLGVFLRGSDYTQSLCSCRDNERMKNILSVVLKASRIFNINRILLMTEDQLVASVFQSEFGNMTFHYNSYSIDSTKPLFEHSWSFNQIIDLHQEYIRNILLLSQLDYVIMSTTNASILYNILRVKKPTFSYSIS